MPKESLWGIVMGFPKDPKLKGLAAVCYRPEAVPWEHDIRAVLPESDEVPRVSDWHRRHGRAHNKARSIERAAEARVSPVPDAGKGPGKV